MSDFPGNDYAAVSKFRLEGVHDWQIEEGMTDATFLATAIDAQAQATLALAFEQRTANLIAKMALNVQVGAALVHLSPSFNAIDKEAMTRLGLDTE